MRFEKGRFYILVMREQFVLVAQIDQAEEALFLRLSHAAVVRIWGTSRGLGQLAEEGPRSGTKLDPEHTELVNKLEVSRIIRCGDAWNAWRPQ